MYYVNLIRKNCAFAESSEKVWNWRTKLGLIQNLCNQIIIILLSKLMFVIGINLLTYIFHANFDTFRYHKCSQIALIQEEFTKNCRILRSFEFSVVDQSQNLGGGPFRRRRFGDGQLGTVPFRRRTFRRRFLIFFYFLNCEEKTMKQAISWMPLSATLLNLESSILPRAKRATNRNNVATEQRI